MNIKTTLAAAALAVSMAGTASAQSLTAETPEAGSDANQIVTLFSKYASQAGHQIRINAGQTATRSVINVARGNSAFAVSLPPIENFFSKGAAMYKQLGEKAVELSPNLRTAFGWLSGTSMLLAGPCLYRA